VETTIKHIISGIFVVMIIVLVGFWGNSTLTTLANQYGWDLFIGADEIAAQKDSKEIFDDLTLSLTECMSDESVNCFCIKEEINLPTDFRLEFSKKESSTDVILKSSRVTLDEKNINFIPCLLLEPWRSSVSLNGPLTLLYGNDKIINKDYEGFFDSSSVFYKMENNNLCIVSVEVANSYDIISLECSEKDESFDSWIDAAIVFDSEIDNVQLNQYVSLASINSNFVNNADKIIKGIIYLESYNNGIFTNREILKHQGTGKYFEGKGKGISSLQVIESGPAYEAIGSDEGRRILNLYGYSDVDFSDDYLSALLINDPEFSISLAYVYLSNSIEDFSNVQNTNDLFKLWLINYNKASLEYGDYVNKINLLNSRVFDIGIENSQVISEDQNPHRI